MVEDELNGTADQILFQFKAELLKHHMTQKELADRIGTGPQQLSRALHGDTSPRSREIRRDAAKKLGFYREYRKKKL